MKIIAGKSAGYSAIRLNGKITIEYPSKFIKNY